MTWSSSRTDARSRISGGCPLTLRAAAANRAASKQCAMLYSITSRGERHVSPDFSVLYGRSSRKRWIFSGVESLRSTLSMLGDNVSNDIGNPGRFKRRRIDADDGDISRGKLLGRDIVNDLEVVADGLLAFHLRFQLDANRSSQANGLRKLRESFHTREPHPLGFK